jgi:biotin carboxyl carrier protein
MPKRLRVMHEDADWSAEAAGRRITLDDGGGRFEVTQPDDPGRYEVAGAGESFVGTAAVSGGTVWVSIAGHVFDFRVGHATSASRATARDTDALMPPMPATVTRIAVKVGDAVKQGDVLIALEAMKMELPIRAPDDFTISAIHCAVGELVQPGTVLIE